MSARYFYLATPYSKYPGGLEAAFQLACKQAALLINAGAAVYSPIAHTHGIAMLGQLDPLDHAIWLPLDQPMMDNACGLVMLKATGWRVSYGMGEEYKAFRQAQKPVVWMEPNVIPEAFRYMKEAA